MDMKEDNRRIRAQCSWLQFADTSKTCAINMKLLVKSKEEVSAFLLRYSRTVYCIYTHRKSKSALN